MVRRRDGTEEPLPIKDATVQVDFYDPGTAGAPDDSLEHWLDRGIENPVGEIMVSLRKGNPPTSTADRGTLARFIAVQMVRTIAFRDQLRDIDSHLWPWFFATEVVRKVVESDATLKDDPDQLQALHEYYASRAPQRPGVVNKDSLMRTMIREADRLLPVLLSMEFMITESSTPQLLTGDTPVVTVNGTGEVTYGPMLLPNFHEVHLPVTPERLLTISPLRPLGQTALLTAEQAGIVNRAIIRSCTTSVFRRPDMPWPGDLALPRQRLPLHSPTVNISHGNGQPAKKPKFPAIVDQTLKDALDLLGGNPEITWP
jgi:hypothetical protein